MATNLPNRAQITYNGSDVVLSNQTNTVLADQYTMTVTTESVTPTVVPGSDVVYAITLNNTGQGDLYNISVTDDLGGVLTYVDGSARFYINGAPVTGTATVIPSVARASSVQFETSEVLNEGDTLTIIFAATVPQNQSEDIVNTVTATANGGSVTGTEVTATDTATTPVKANANISIFKSASRDTVFAGDTLSYTFTLMNTGGAEATGITFSDALPPEFTVQAVTITANGVTTPVEATDYTITDPNTLTMPAADSTLTITVPPSTAEGPGVTVITITGVIA